MQARPFTLLRSLRLIVYWLSGLAGFYVLLYLTLSLCGSYQPLYSGGLRYMEAYPTWAPFGFYDPNQKVGTWRGTPIRVFYPLWIFDIQHIHKTKQPNHALQPTATAPSVLTKL